MKNVRHLLLLLSVIFLSCSNPKNKAKDFVAYYNKSVSPQFLDAFTRINEQAVGKTYAELSPLKLDSLPEIRIVFVAKLAFTDPDIDLYQQYIPTAFTTFIAADKRAKSLLEDGVKFKVIYSSRNERQVSELLIDKAKMAELLKEKAGKNLAVGKGLRNANLRPEVKQLLITLNNTLPIVIDQDLQTTITKIDVNSLNELVYTIEVGDEMKTVLKGANAKAAMKEEVLSNPKLGTFYHQMRNIGLANIKYVYTDKAGNKLNELLITQEDF